MPSSTSSTPKERFQQRMRKQPPPTSPVSSDREAANRRGEALAAAMRKLPDNPQVEY